MSKSIEYLFVEEFYKRLDELIVKETDFVTNAVLEPSEYPYHVGRIKATKELKEEFTQLLRAYFPST